MEALVTCDESEISKVSINFWNPTTGTKLLSLRGPPAHPQSLTLIRDEGFLIIESGKPFIHIWQAGHTLQTSRRILCPGKPGTIAMSPDASYLAVGIEEKIYIWQVSTGKIVSVINSAHYRPVNVLKFTDDGTYLVSGGQDGMVLCWKLIILVSGQSTIPKYTWTDHSLPITDIHIGFGGAKGTIFTASLDRTAKIYSLNSGSLLLSVSFPVTLTAVVADTAEFAFYVGSSTGSIYQIKLHSAPRSIEHHISSDAVADHVFKKHKDPITTLSISADAKVMASGDSSGIVLLWDTESKQAIKTISGTKTKITNLLFWLGNPEILKGGRKPTIIFPEVPKLVEQSDDRSELDKVVMVWNRFEKAENVPIVQTSTTTDSLNIQISKLKAELARTSQINSKLHEFCLEQIMNQEPPEVVVSDPIPEKKSSSKKRKKKSQPNEETEEIEPETIAPSESKVKKKKGNRSELKLKKLEDVQLKLKRKKKAQLKAMKRQAKMAAQEEDL